MKYRTSDNVLIEADNSRDLIKKLREASHEKEKSMTAFKAAMLKRIQQQTGRRLSIESESDFVTALLHIGLIKVEE